MNLAKAAFGMTNKLLSAFGLSISKVIKDFDSRLDDQHVGSLFQAMALEFNQWANKQIIFKQQNSFDTELAVTEFYKMYLISPFRDRDGGSRFNNALWLYLIAKMLQPSIIIDCGTYTGGSAWALSLGCPDATVLSFDIDLSRLRVRAPRVQYIQSDWAQYNFSNIATKNGLCYFDDHVDQVQRLLEAHARGFPLAIFDDDYPITSFAAMAHSGASLPKIEFLFDDSFSKTDELSWVSNGRPLSWKIDNSYLDKARQVIAATERLPNTSLITGIHQTPYRVVKIKEPL